MILIHLVIWIIYSYSLYPLILRPTRITDKSETLIDNILIIVPTMNLLIVFLINYAK